MAYTMCQRGLNVVVPLWHHRPLIIIIIIAPEKVNTPIQVSSNATSIRFQWCPVNEGSVARSYDVIQKNGAAKSRVTSTNETSVIIHGLQSNSAYTYSIRAKNTGGNGEYSDEATFYTGTFACCN